jgi:pilus assembly protein CpaB
MGGTMSTRKRFIVGAACSVCAVALVLVYAAQVRAQEREVREEALARYGGEQVEVCVATRTIAIGEKLDARNTTQCLWVADLLPADCVTSLEQVESAVAGSTILANEPISKARLGTETQELEVPAGLCAVSIPSQDVRAVGGAIVCGSRVNVYASTDTGVVLLGENLLVLETNNTSQEVSSTHTVLSWVTLAVTPQSVQQLLNASRMGNLYLTLPAETGGDDRHAS